MTHKVFNLSNGVFTSLIAAFKKALLLVFFCIGLQTISNAQKKQSPVQDSIRRAGAISLKGSNDKFVSSENGKLPIHCNRGKVADWEKFAIEDAGNGKIALKATNGKYVSAEDGKLPITCKTDAISDREKFTIEDAGNGKIALKATNGKYLSLNKDDNSISCIGTAAGDNEKFNWETVNFPVKPK
jgi:hypothetical protein